MNCTTHVITTAVLITPPVFGNADGVLKISRGEMPALAGHVARAVMRDAGGLP